MAAPEKRDAPFWFSSWAVDVDDTHLSRRKLNPTLPGRECAVCGERELHIELARYDLAVPRSVNLKLLKGENTLSPGEFDLLLDKLKVTPDVRATLLPGTEIGKPVFRLVARQHDFLSCDLIQFVSETVLERTRACGVTVNGAEVEVLGRPRKIKRYFSLLPAIRSIMDEDWLSQELVQCPTCEQWRLKPGIRLRKKVLIDKAHVWRRKWPKNQGVVYSPDLGNMLYSPAFVEACREAGLTGLGFEPVNWA